MTTPEERVPTGREMAQEGDGAVVGPGLVATKSQSKGGLAGIALGGFLGAIAGAILGAFIFGGIFGIVISAICFAFAGGTIGVLLGGTKASEANVSPTSPADN